MSTFNCPDGVAILLKAPDTPLLRAVAKLGPERVQWIGTPPTGYGGNTSVANAVTCWGWAGRNLVHSHAPV